MPKVTRKSSRPIERKYNFFNRDSEETSTEEEYLPPKNGKLNDDSKLKLNIKPAGFNDEDQENNAPGTAIMLHQLPVDKQNALETENYQEEQVEEEAYVESVEAAFHSQVESSLKLSFEYQKCIESAMNKGMTSAEHHKTQDAKLSKSVYHCLKTLKECQADQIGNAESVLKLQASYKKQFEDTKKKLKEEAKAMQNDMENYYMALQKKIKNDIKRERNIVLRKALHDALEL